MVVVFFVDQGEVFGDWILQVIGDLLCCFFQVGVEGDVEGCLVYDVVYWMVVLEVVVEMLYEDVLEGVVVDQVEDLVFVVDYWQ